MLDGHVIVLQYHALDEESDDSLAAGEVEVLDARSQRRGECADVVSDLLCSIAGQFLGSELPLVRLRRLAQRMQLLASCLVRPHPKGTESQRTEDDARS